MPGSSLLFEVLPTLNETYIGNHTDLALNRLITQYKDDKTMKAIIGSIAGHGPQELENAILSMDRILDPNSQAGKGLDLLGEIVGAKRQGRSDDTYRLIVKIKIASNTSHGTREEIIKIWKMFSGATDIEVKELGNATIEIASNSQIIFGVDDYVRELFKSIVAGGVEIYSYYYPEYPFAFFTDPDDLSTGGFGDVNDPDAGGFFSTIII